MGNSKEKKDKKKNKKSNKKRYDSDDSYEERHKHKKSSVKSGNKKSHKKRNDPTASSSDSSTLTSDDEKELLQRLKYKQEEILLEKRKQKEAMKANETAEEKRLRRLLKKEAKERKRKQRMGWDKDYLHYTNSDNPFGDANLLATFVWTKKLTKEGLDNLTREDLERINRQKQEENKLELEKVKKRRQERELEKQQREEAMMLMQREKEAEQFEVWENQEDEFHLDQARLRSKIRIADGRAKPIDLLAKYINSEEEVDAVEMHEPYTYLNGLSIQDLEDLIEDIKVYIKLEKGKNLDYWNDITVIVEDELHKLRKLKKSSYELALGRREGIHESVASDVASVFKGKTAEQLAALQKQIEKKIHDKAEGVDIGYWESLLSQLKAHMARVRLRDRHQENLKKKLELLKAEQGVEGDDDDNSEINEIIKEETKINRGNDKKYKNDGQSVDDDKDDNDDDVEEEEEEENMVEKLLQESFQDYERGCYSPSLLQPNDLEPGTLIITEEDDEQRLIFKRLQVQKLGSSFSSLSIDAAGPSSSTATDELQIMHREARKGMTDDEALFSVESHLEPQVHLWSDKYRPRKPRYFNRVHTGFEWNKYNQTHYDMENPPPKIVQGYKFNIFYPDLIDKHTTPEYFLTSCPDNVDFAILRFHAGPPYEDIAFKIVNREWEYSYKRGFRCQFHNNIFQLWFHFKRYRYRR